MLGVHNVSIICTYTLDTGESADTTTFQRRRVGEGSFGNIASFNMHAGSSSYADPDLVNRADLILMDRSASVRLNNIFCNDAATYKCLFQYNRNQVLYPVGSLMVLTIEDPVLQGDIHVSYYPSGKLIAGSNVMLDCMVGGNPAPTYRWVKESDVIMTMDGRKWVLTDLILCDSGFYTCHASNTVNGTTYSGSGTIRINVGCSDGTYGPDCTEKCGKCDGVCDRVDGRCPAGCLEGYNGTKCDVFLPTKCASNKDQASSCVASLVGAVVGTFLMVVLLGVGIIICLIRQGRLNWVKIPDHKEPVDVSRDSTNMTTVDTQHDLAEHAHTYNNDYTVLDPNTAADNKEYDVIKH